MNRRHEGELRGPGKPMTESDLPCAPTFRIGRWRVDATRPEEPGAGLWVGAAVRLLRSGAPVDAPEIAAIRAGLDFDLPGFARELGLAEASLARLERDEDFLEPWLRLALEGYLLRQCLPGPPIGGREGIFGEEPG
jgi:hypothetical protein